MEKCVGCGCKLWCVVVCGVGVCCVWVGLINWVGGCFG